MEKKAPLEGVEVETLRAETKSDLVLVEEAISGLVFKEPIDRIIAENYGNSDSKIAAIVKEKLGERMTKQAIQKRRAKNVKPLIMRGLELKMVIREDQERVEEEPVRGAPEDEEQLESEMMTREDEKMVGEEPVQGKEKWDDESMDEGDGGNGKGKG